MLLGQFLYLLFTDAVNQKDHLIFISGAAIAEGYPNNRVSNPRLIIKTCITRSDRCRVLKGM